jgi:hypothetical protein
MPYVPARIVLELPFYRPIQDLPKVDAPIFFISAAKVREPSVVVGVVRMCMCACVFMNPCRHESFVVCQILCNSSSLLLTFILLFRPLRTSSAPPTSSSKPPRAARSVAACTTRCPSTTLRCTTATRTRPCPA